MPIINSDLRDQTVNNVLILACFQVMYCSILETYGRLLLFLTKHIQAVREGPTRVPGKEAINSPTPRGPRPLRHRFTEHCLFLLRSGGVFFPPTKGNEPLSHHFGRHQRQSGK